VVKHPFLLLYLAHSPEVPRLIAGYQGQTGQVTGQGQPAQGTSQGEPTGGSAPAFSDVPSWAQQAVGAMCQRGIIRGVGGGLFGSNRVLNRAEFATLLVREFRLSTSGSVYGTMTFVDAPSTFWAYNDIEAAAAANTMTYWTVNGQNYFRPHDPADREDCIVAMVEAAGLAGQTPDPSVLSKFVDAGSISPNLVNLVAIAVSSGLVTGSQGPDGNWHLYPQAVLTRAEGAVLLYRALAYSKVAPGGA